MDFRIDMMELNALIGLIEDAIHEAYRKRELMRQEFIERCENGSFAQRLARMLAEDMDRLPDEFARHLWNGFVVTVRSRVELFLASIYEDVANMKEIVLNDQDTERDNSAPALNNRRNNNKLEALKDDLKKKLNLMVSDEGEEWKSIKHLNILRNIIVHHDGKYNRSRLREKYYHEQSKYLLFNDLGGVNFNSEYCVYIETVEK